MTNPTTPPLPSGDDLSVRLFEATKMRAICPVDVKNDDLQLVGRIAGPFCTEIAGLRALCGEALATIAALNARVEEARWLFAQIGQMHSTDHGDIGERCMELGQKGYALLRDLTKETSDGR